jgi:hypothetical protein
MNQTVKFPIWFWVIAALGLAWNIFGAVQFLGGLGADVTTMMNKGMTEAQAKLYFGLPVWMNIAFAMGVFGGILGCLLLMMRKKLAVLVFWVSLAAYLVLYAGDIFLGVFEVFGTQQVIILTTVVLIAAGLLWLAKKFEKSGQLT